MNIVDKYIAGKVPWAEVEKIGLYLSPQWGGNGYVILFGVCGGEAVVTYHENLQFPFIVWIRWAGGIGRCVDRDVARRIMHTMTSYKRSSAWRTKEDVLLYLANEVGAENDERYFDLEEAKEHNVFWLEYDEPQPFNGLGDAWEKYVIECERQWDEYIAKKESA